MNEWTGDGSWFCFRSSVYFILRVTDIVGYSDENKGHLSWVKIFKFDFNRSKARDKSG